MQFSISAVLLASAGSALADCVTCRSPGNNCARGVRGTSNDRPPLKSRLADCAAALQVTVTPAPVISTVTTTLTPALSAQPAYATYCSGPAEWVSACKCAGVVATTFTTAAQTVYVTETVVESTCAATTTCTVVGKGFCTPTPIRRRLAKRLE